MTTFAPSEQGSLVQVRQRPFLVVDAQRTYAGPVRHENVGRHLVPLISVEDDALGKATMW